MIGFLSVFFSNFVPKTHRFWDIRLLSIQWSWNAGWGHSKSSKIIPSNPAPTTSYWRSIVTIGLSRTVSEINGDVRRKSHENRQFSHPPCIWRTRWRGSPWNFLSAQGSQETRVMGLSVGRKSFRIGLAVLVQYRSVTASQPPSRQASQPLCRSYYALCYRVEPKKKLKLKLLEEY